MSQPAHGITFLGVTDHLDYSDTNPFPYGGVNLFSLSRCKPHFLYPPLTEHESWVFLISTEGMNEEILKTLKISIKDKQDYNFDLKISSVVLQKSIVAETAEKNQIALENYPKLLKKNKPILEKKSEQELASNYSHSFEHHFLVTADNQPMIFWFKNTGVINKPGRYYVYAGFNDQDQEIGFIDYIYTPAHPLTPDKILAIKSNADSKKLVFIELGCKFCTKK